MGDRVSDPVTRTDENDHEDEPVRAMYRRMAAAYNAQPTVPDYGGGVPGDRYPLDTSEVVDLGCCNDDDEHELGGEG